MNSKYITVDGMLSGTGVRDSVAGGYIDPAELGLSESTIQRIAGWLARYENAHYAGFGDKAECEALDREGLRICVELQHTLPKAKVEYYSHAQQVKIGPETLDLTPSRSLDNIQ